MIMYRLNRLAHSIQRMVLAKVSFLWVRYNVAHILRTRGRQLISAKVLILLGFFAYFGAYEVFTSHEQIAAAKESASQCMAVLSGDMVMLDKEGDKIARVEWVKAADLIEFHKD